MRTRFWTTMFAGTTATVLMAAPAAAQMRRVNINSAPPGATVRLDVQTSAPIGTTPIRNRSVRAGAHTLFFELQGYVPGRLDVNVRRNGEAFTGSLQQGGSINVSSDAPGTLTIDGQERGMTPTRIDGLAAGQHVVEVRVPNQPPFSQTVTVQAGGVAAVSARPAVGTVRVVLSNPNGPVPPNAVVAIDGTPLTGTPPSSDQITPGTHVVQVTAQGFSPVTQQVTVTAGQTQAVAITLGASGGTVRVVTSTTGAEVYLDGERVAGTPAMAPNVPAGTHTIRVTAPGRATVTREVTVTAGQVTALDLGDLAAASQSGRISIRASVPAAVVVIDGSVAGPAPYERADAPPGEHIVIVHAEGYEDLRRTCTVSATSPCEVVADMQRARTMGVVHIEAMGANGQMVPNALVRIGDDPEPHPLGDLQVPTGEVRITVVADNHEPFVQTVNVVTGATAVVRAPMRRLGLTSNDVARRRSAISTWGAAPLLRGDGAFDVFTGIFGMPAEFRATMGFLPQGVFAIDGGLSIRTLFTWWEFELRSRIGLRLLDDTLAVGGEVRFYGALGTGNRNGVGGTLQLNFSAHFSLAGDEVVAGESPQDRANRFGSFAFTLSPGVEINGDNYTGANPPTYTPAGDSEARSLCENRTADMPNPGDCTLSTTTRGYLQGTIEMGLGRHLNGFAGLQYYLAVPDEVTSAASGSGGARRAVLSDSFWSGPQRAIVRLGITYKF